MPIIYFFLFQLYLSQVANLEDEASWICATIVGCTAWIVESIKRRNQKYKPLNPIGYIVDFFKDEYNDFKNN